jgi:hypothetical protein
VTDGQRSVESASAEAENLFKVLKRRKSKQVSSEDEKQIIKAVMHAWFNNHRATLISFLGHDAIKPLDDLYRMLLGSAAKATIRSKYLAGVKAIKRELAALQADHVVSLAKGTSPTGSSAVIIPTTDEPPQFTPLISDPKMQLILRQRWRECVVCVKAGAPLAATVMMGGILEGLLLARINQLPNKTSVFTAAAAPKEGKTGTTLPLKEWGLKNYIDVAHELKWITTAAKDIGVVLRDYRNYIHPQKELSHGISLAAGDAEMLWNVAKSVTLQILKP